MFLSFHPYLLHLADFMLLQLMLLLDFFQQGFR
jgi:hypothetical protein